ncbi:MAG: PAS domain S-box protein [Syntrophobacteraceae bacterium]
MIWNRRKRPFWLSGIAGSLIAIAAATVRLWFLGTLGQNAPFLTFYPAVAAAALYGGIGGGLAATAASAILTSYFWVPPIGRLAIADTNDILSMAIFCFSCILISCLAEAAYRARDRAYRAEEMSTLSAEREKAALDLQRSESKYRELVQNANSAIIRWKSDGSVVFFNEYAQKFFGYSAEEIIGKSVSILLPQRESTGNDLSALLRTIVDDPAKYAKFVNENVLKDGSRVWMAWTNKAVLNQDGQVVEVLAVGSDITERKRAEENTARLAAIVESSEDAIIGKTLDGVIASWNHAAEIIYGYSAEEAVGKPISMLLPEGDPDDLPRIFERIGRAESIAHYETRRKRKDGKVIDVSLSVSPIKDSSGNIVGASAISRDITERRRMQLENEITVEILKIINTSRGMADLVKDAAIFFQKQSRCEAVGVRLKEKEDFPYFEARGFPEEFVRLENSLCARDAGGAILRDSCGNPRLECMCGNVILKRVDPSKPFFSPGGSFWANDTTRLLATTSDADRQTRTRNRCNGEGYESVALIPLHIGGERLGLIQLNDRRKNMFSPETIALWEKLAGYLAVAIGRLRSEEELREQREKLQVTLTSVGDAVIATNAMGKVSFINPVAAKLTSWPREEALGKPIQEVFRTINERTGAPAEDVVGHVLRDGRLVALSNHTALVTRDGREIPIEDSAAPIRNDEGLVSGVVLVFHDVTERRRAQEALRERERYFHSILFSMNEDIMVIDKDYRIVDVNKDVLVTFGHTREEMVGRRCYEVLRGRQEACSEPEYRCYVKEVFQNGKPLGARRHRTDSHGSTVYLDIHYSPLRDDRGNVSHVITGAIDVTEHVKVSEQFKQAQKMEAIGNLAGGIAHDFNNILGIIMGYSEMAIEDASSKEETIADVSQVLQAAHRAKDLVQQILAFSRRGGKEATLVPVGSLVKEVAKMLRAAIPSTIEIHQDIATQPGEDSILADPTQLHQMLMNLCTNARQAMGERVGVLGISLDSVELDQEKLPGDFELKPGSYVRLTVSDTGAGMSKDVQERIFEPYFTTKGVGEGTGLGLSVVHGIVKDYGGGISVYSEPGVGTIFKVYLPRFKQEPSKKVEAPPSIPRGSERVLFVDDEKHLADLGKKLLERLGYSVTSKTSSIEAFEVFRAHPDDFDLIITDQTMPRMTGLELSEKAIQVRSRIPIILCTGFSKTISQEKMKPAGIREILVKPLLLKDVSVAVRRVLDEGNNPQSK